VPAQTWLPDTRGFVFDGLLTRTWLRRAIALIHARALVAATDSIEPRVRRWEASRPGTPAALARPCVGSYRQ